MQPHTYDENRTKVHVYAEKNSSTNFIYLYKNYTFALRLREFRINKKH